MNGKNFRKPETVKKEFNEIPNYNLTYKTFDVRYLDKFLDRINESGSLKFPVESSVEGKSQMQYQDKVLTNIGIEDTVEDD